MSATFIPLDAWQYAFRFVSDSNLASVQTMILQDAASRIWVAAPWRWSVGVLTAVPLTANTQNFTVTLPADFLRLEKPWLSNGIMDRSLIPVSSLPVSDLEALPNFVTIVAGSPAKVWFDTLFGPITSGETWNFRATYKKVSPDLTASVGTPGALVMDDDYFWVYREGVLYYAYKYADDSRAGGATVAMTANGGRQIQYSGQLAVFMAGIEEIRQKEELLWAPPGVPVVKT